MSIVDEAGTVTKLQKYKTIVSNGQSTLKALLTMNGGATIAFLTFIGHLMEKGTPQPQNLQVLLGALQYFILGTFFAVLGYGLIFLTNCFSYVEWNKTTNAMFGLTLVSSFASIGCFLFASARAVAAFGAVTQSRTAMLYF